jgi:hypothetical protein
MTFSLNIKTAEDLRAEEQSIKASQVTKECERRLSVGVVVTVSGYGEIPVQGRQKDQINLIGLEATAKDLVQAGVEIPVIKFRDGSNVNHMLTPSQFVEMARKGKEAASEIIQTSWDMKDGNGNFSGGIPDGFADDKYWDNYIGEENDNEEENTEEEQQTTEP